MSLSQAISFQLGKILPEKHLSGIKSNGQFELSALQDLSQFSTSVNCGKTIN
jgi:hypothetical protein